MFDRPSTVWEVDIGIIGAGQIGSTLARQLVAPGHDVRLVEHRAEVTLATAGNRTSLTTSRRASTAGTRGRDPGSRPL